MYIPQHFKVTDKQTIYEFIEENGFGIIISTRDHIPIGTHLPLILDRENECLTGHFAKANEQWDGIEGQEVLIIFHGPHHYISSSWYETSKSVPTWNYVAVHVYGTIELLKNEHEVLGDLETLMSKYEGSNSYSFDDSNSEFIQGLMQGIVGFRIKVHRFEGKWKLSQNHSDERRKKVIDALENIQSENAEHIANLMKKNM